MCVSCTTGGAQDGSSSRSQDAAASASAGSGSPSGQAGAEPVQTSTTAGPCPYLTQDDVELVVGQRIAQVTVTTTTPAPGPLPRCEFQRSSGEPVAVVDTLTIAAGEGMTKSLELVPGGNPVKAGEGGSVVVHQGQAKTELAAYAGTVLVTVTINQESSLEATELAEQVLTAAG